MDFRNVLHLREVLVTDAYAKTTGVMQYSTQKISRFRPDFSDVPFKHQDRARELYQRCGGRRLEGMRIGTAVILDFDELGESA